MQAVQAIGRFIGLLLFTLSVACSPAIPHRVAPTPIVGNERVISSTPTLISGQRLAMDLPTPELASLPDEISEKRNGSIGDPYIPELGNRGYDVQAYSLSFSLDPSVMDIRAAITIEALVTDNVLSQMSLDFVGFDIIDVNVNGQSTSFNREAKKLLVNLPQPVSLGTSLSVTITYRGTPTREASPYVNFTDSLGLSFGDGHIYTLSEPDGARYWYPCNDHPRDKARFRFELTVPADLVAVANGRLIGVQAGGLKRLPDGGKGTTFIWEHDYPMATYLALVAVGPFQRIEATSEGGVPLRHYVTEEFRDEFEAVVVNTGEVVDWMSALFGPYPFEEFGYVAMELPPTAMETQTMVLMSNELIGRRTAVHELAHMWFGNWVTPESWSEMWRKEGFATYVAMMWESGDDPEVLDRQVENIMAAVAVNLPQYPIGRPPPEKLLSYNTYFKGAAFIHALRREMGDEAFFAGTRSYLQRFGGGTASDEEFRTAMEEAAGFPLEALFAEWLN